MNMQGSFWSAFGVRFDGNMCAIDELLQKDEVVLEDLLRQDDILQECKYMNGALIDYLSERDTVEKLIQYVIMPPPDTDGTKPAADANDSIIFPYIASELFACEVVTMLDAMFAHPELLRLLFSFLDRPTPLEPGTASYFRKLVVVLIQRKYAQLVQFIQGEPDILQKMINHIGLYSVMELLIMIGWDDGLGQVNDVHWLHEENVIPLLVEKLDPKYADETEVHVNAARALVDVVVKSPLPVPSSDLSDGGENSSGDDDDDDSGNNNQSSKAQGAGGGEKEKEMEDALLVSQLISPPVLQRLFVHMFVGSASALVTFICVLFCVASYRWCECSCDAHSCSLLSAHANLMINMQLYAPHRVGACLR
jgi:hypothetical protein